MTIRVVHIGAGRHSLDLTAKYKKLIKTSLTKESVIESSHVLESSDLTNTGYGSSLDVYGRVESDASIIETKESQNQLAVTGLTSAYPIEKCHRLMQKLLLLYESEGCLFEKLKLSKPIVLSNDATQEIEGLLRQQSIEFEPEEQSEHHLVLKKAADLYRHMVEYLETIGKVDEIQDTIGVMELSELNSFIASSSGGNFFKLPGRVGCAGVPGCAIDYQSNGEKRTYCMCSGNGEAIIKKKLARTVAERLLDEVDVTEELEHVLKEVYAGVIVIVQSKEDTRLYYGHSTESFYFGFTDSVKKEVILSTAGEGKVAIGEYKLVI